MAKTDWHREDAHYGGNVEAIIIDRQKDKVTKKLSRITILKRIVGKTDSSPQRINMTDKSAKEAIQDRFPSMFGLPCRKDRMEKAAAKGAIEDAARLEAESGANANDGFNPASNTEANSSDPNEAEKGL